MYAGKVAAGSTPISRASPVVYGETVRTASARRRAAVPSRSTSGPSTRRADEPYSRVAVRQSPCSSTTTLARLPASRRPSMQAAASYGLWASTASGSKSRQLAGDPQRQRELEGEAVERARPEGRHERERAVANGRPGGRAREHPQLERAAERVELPGEARLEREPVARAADDQQLRHRAASSRICSSSP